MALTEFQRARFRRGLVSTDQIIDADTGDVAELGASIEGISDVPGLQAALDAKQASDADLTAIAALSTTAYGRSLLALADAAALRTAVGVGCLAAVQYTGAGTTPWFSTASTTLVDVDATNAAVTFTAPSSLKVLVNIQCGTAWSSAVSLAGFGVREGSTAVASSAIAGNAIDIVRGNVDLLITGISAGSHTYKFAVKRVTGTGTLNVYAQTEHTFVMSVWAVP